jgi:hypothetical protein
MNLRDYIIKKLELKNYVKQTFMVWAKRYILNLKTVLLIMII